MISSYNNIVNGESYKFRVIHAVDLGVPGLVAQVQPENEYDALDAEHNTHPDHLMIAFADLDLRVVDDLVVLARLAGQLKRLLPERILERPYDQNEQVNAHHGEYDAVQLVLVGYHCL